MIKRRQARGPAALLPLAALLLVLAAAAPAALAGMVPRPADGADGAAPAALPAAASGSQAQAFAAAAAQADATLAAAAPSAATAALDRVAAGQPADFIVTFAVPAASGRRLLARGGGSAGVMAMRAARARAAKAVKASVLADVAAAAPSAGAGDVIHDFSQLPVMAVSINSTETLDALKNNPSVLSVREVRRSHVLDAESQPLMHQPQAAALGFVGDGCAVAVIDTGADYTQPDLGSCAAAGDPGCKVVFSKDMTATDDGMRDDPAVSTHGTNVASIVASVAPGARVVALDVFDGLYAQDVTILAAINFVLENHDPSAGNTNKAGPWNFCSINLSLGEYDFHADPCGTSPYEAAFAHLRAAGVLSAVAAGNEAQKDKIAAPGCAPSAVSVGAVYDSDMKGGLTWGDPSSYSCTDRTIKQDAVTCFSNSAYYLTVLAPGALINAGGVELGGTSQASPHIAGSLAVLRAAAPTASPDVLVKALTATGTPIRDSNGITKPRVDLEAAVKWITNPDNNTPAVVAPPTPTLLINGGADYTNTQDVRLTVTPPAGMTEMCASEDFLACGAGGTWVPVSTSPVPFSLNGKGSGVHAVRVYFRDASKAISSTYVEDSIILDSKPPQMQPSQIAFRGNPTANTIDLSFNYAATDTGSGVGDYLLVAYSGGKAPPKGCASDGATPISPTSSRARLALAARTGAPGAGPVPAAAQAGAGAGAAAGPLAALQASYKLLAPKAGTRAGAWSYTLAELTPGTTYRFRLCAVDGAGNASPGIVRAVRTLKA